MLAIVGKRGQAFRAGPDAPPGAFMHDAIADGNGNVTSDEREPLFIAAGRPVYPFVATKEAVVRIASFLHNFPLATNSDMSDEQIFNFIVAPWNVFVESGPALIMLQDVEIGKAAHVGFVFWDRKVAGNEEFIVETLMKLQEMLKLHRFYTQVPDRNRTMMRMIERVGFTQEGRLREAFLMRSGEWCDIHVYGALKGELGVKHTA
jgi:hypothetical protein